MPTMTVLIGNMGDTVVRTVREATDWTGRKTRLLPEYINEGMEKKERKSEEVKKDQASSASSRTVTRECPIASPPPSFSAGRTSPMRNNVGPSSISPSGEGREEAPVSSQLQIESPLETRNEEEHTSDPSASQKPKPKPKQSKRESSSHSASQVHAEAILLAREISKLAKDLAQQPPKKYGWEEWVNWLKVLGDEAWVTGGVEGIGPEASTNLQDTDTSANLSPDRPDHEHRRHPNKHHRRYRSQPNPLKMEADPDGASWNWTWLDDKGPLFSPETETEWILSRLCSRLEHLLNDDYT